MRDIGNTGRDSNIRVIGVREGDNKTEKVMKSWPEVVKYIEPQI